MAFRLFLESSRGRRRGRRPRPQRIDAYAAHFHHHPWRDASLQLTPRLRKRLGDGVGGTAYVPPRRQASVEAPPSGADVTSRFEVPDE